MKYPRSGLILGALLFVSTAHAQSDRPDRPVFTPRMAQRTMAMADSIHEAVKMTRGNKVGLCLSNYGYFGNNFVNRNPSLEYPMNSGIEHFARAGLWVGARAVDAVGSFTGVTTAVLDGSLGFDPGPGSEFTPAGTSIVELSNDPHSPVYSPAFSLSPARRLSVTRYRAPCSARVRHRASPVARARFA